MGLQDVISADRIHIAFFGMRNTGKSSLVNGVTGQSLSVVSPVKGTTTDPVKKAMELLPLGPVLIIDTPGLDDQGTLGQLRIQKTKQILAQTDIAVLVADCRTGLLPEDEKLIQAFQEKHLPYIIVYNKADLLETELPESESPGDTQGSHTQIKGCPLGCKEEKEGRFPGPPAAREYAPLCTSAVTGQGIHQLKEVLGSLAQKLKKNNPLISDLLESGDMVVLVMPIDESAPKGRLILPQQMTLREILDAHCIGIACQDGELKTTLQSFERKPRLVITDSQVFRKIAPDTPKEIPLTSFSILMARYKGTLKDLVRGAALLAQLRDGDKVLISEGCTHHRQCNDIGTVKMPRWIKEFSGGKPDFTFSSGGGFPDDLSPYKLIIHCGGCMLSEKEMQHRIGKAKETEIPIVNYGIAIAQMNGILKRALQPFPDMAALLDSF